MRVYLKRDRDTTTEQFKAVLAAIRTAKPTPKVYLVGELAGEWEIVLKNDMDGLVLEPERIHRDQP